MDELLGEALVTILRGNVLVAGLVDERIFPRRLPQRRQLPAIRYGDGATTEFVAELGGTQQDAVTTLKVSCLAVSDQGAKRLARLVRRALHAYRGTVAALRISRVIVTGQGSADFQPKEDGSDDGIYEETLDVTVHYVVT